MLAVASLKRSLEFDPVEQGVKRKRAEMKLSPPSSPISSSSSSTTTSTTFTMNNTNPSSPSKQQQQPSIFTSSSPNKNQSLVFKKPCSLTALTSSSSSTTDDTPMFSYAQTAQMCARLLREQDRSIREQYEQLLTDKLTEQYDTFVRYTHDSVHKNPANHQHRLFHFGQPQETTNPPTDTFSYSS